MPFRFEANKIQFSLIYCPAFILSLFFVHFVWIRTSSISIFHFVRLNHIIYSSILISSVKVLLPFPFSTFLIFGLSIVFYSNLFLSVFSFFLFHIFFYFLNNVAILFLLFPTLFDYSFFANFFSFSLYFSFFFRSFAHYFLLFILHKYLSFHLFTSFCFYLHIHKNILFLFIWNISFFHPIFLSLYLFLLY